MKHLLTPFFFFLLFLVPQAHAADTVLSEQTDGTNFLEAMRLGQTGDGYNVHELFDTTVNNIANVTSLTFWAKKAAGTTCNHFHVSMYSDTNMEAQGSSDEVNLTDSWAEYTVGNFSAVNTVSFPGGLYNLAEIRFNTMTNSALCSYSVIGSVNPVSGHHFVDYDQGGDSLMYTLVGSFGTPALNNSDAAILYGLNIIHPTTSNYPYYNTTAATPSEEFKVSYRVPSAERRDDRSVVLWMSDYSDFTVGQLLVADSIATLDPDNDGVFSVSVAVATTTKYYEMSIVDSNDSDNVKSSLNFVVNGDGSQLTQLRNTDLGFWGNLFRSLFVPSQDALNAFSSVKDDLMSKMPFNYYSESVDILNGISLTEATSSPAMSITYFSPHGTTTMSMLNIDKAKQLTGGAAVSFDLLYNLIKYALYLRFLVYVYQRVTGIFAPHQMNLF